MYQVEELYFKKEEKNIYGQIYIPKIKKEKYPAVIIGHCFGGSYKDNIEYASYLAENGYVVYIFDFCGGANNSKSDGDTREMSVLTEVEDMKKVLENIRQLDYIDTDNIFLMGESQGGLVAGLVAAQKSEEVKGLIMLYPALSIIDDAKNRYKGIEHIPLEVNLWGVHIGKKYYTDLWDKDIFSEMSKFKKDVLILHGNKDTLVDISYSEKISDMYNSSELVIYENGKHRFGMEQVRKAENKIVDFFKKNID